MPFQFNEMSKLVAENPEKAAGVLREIVAQGGTAQTIADRYGVAHRTVIRWHARLREQLGDKIGFALREGRRPAPTTQRKTKRSKKKSRSPKKVVAN